MVASGQTDNLGVNTSTSLQVVGHCVAQIHSMATALTGRTISDRRDSESSRLGTI